MSIDTEDPAKGHRERVLALGGDVADLLKDIVDRTKELRELGVPAREWLDIVAQNVPAPAAKFIYWASGYLAAPIDGGLAFLAGADPTAAGAVIFEAFKEGRQEHEAEEVDPYEVSLIGARRAAKGILRDEHLDVHGDADLVNLCTAFLAVDADMVRCAEDPATIRMREVISRLFNEAPKLEGAADQAPALEVHILLRSGAPIQFSGILSTTPEGSLRLMTPTKDGNGKMCMIEQFFDYSDVTSVALVREAKATEGSRIIS